MSQNVDTQLPDKEFNIEDTFPAERDRLVRLCARMSGSLDAAEDLAQETLIEAWRHEERLYNPQGYSKWLSAIAQNVCRRWSQRRGREHTRLAPSNFYVVGTGKTQTYLEEHLVDDFDLEIELERKELSELLDRAMSLLPLATSKLLIEKYIHGTSLAEIATRLGVSEGAVAVRLHRAKLALRQLLSTRLKSEAEIYGLCDEYSDKWQETSIWCPMCGQQRMVGRFTPGNGEFRLTCRTCTPEPGDGLFQTEWSDLFSGVKGYKAALTRFMNHSHDYYRHGLLNSHIKCRKHEHTTSLRMGIPLDASPSMRVSQGLHIRCEKCESSSSVITHRGLVRCLPEAQRFWKEHPRLRSLPEQEIEVGGATAILTSFQSVTAKARLDVISLRETFEIVSIHRS
jgi:RNA polymerase sigma factor (sigma-70 family)